MKNQRPELDKPSPSDRSLRGRRASKLQRKVFNERLKMFAGYLHGTALAVLGLGALRFAFDPTEADVGTGWFTLAFVASLAIEGAALYVLGYLRSED